MSTKIYQPCGIFWLDPAECGKQKRVAKARDLLDIIRSFTGYLKGAYFVMVQATAVSCLAYTPPRVTLISLGGGAASLWKLAQ